jgi:phage shock protein C
VECASPLALLAWHNRKLKTDMKLCRSNDNREIAGVCAGLAEYLGWRSGRLRIVWVLATLFTAFAGVVVYLALWYLMPATPLKPKNFEPAVLQPWKKAG